MPRRTFVVSERFYVYYVGVIHYSAYLAWRARDKKTRRERERERERERGEFFLRQLELHSIKPVCV